MKEPFDKKLADKIKTLFQSHEETAPQKEWERFSAAYFNKPVKKKYPIWPWWVSGIAASLALAIWLGRTPEAIEEPNELLSFADTLTKESKSYELEDLGSIETLEDITSRDELGSMAANKRHPVQAVETFTITSAKQAEITSSPAENPLVADISIPETTAELNTHESTYVPFSSLTEKTLDTKSAENYIKNLLAEEEESIKQTSKDPFKLGVLIAPQAVSNANQTISLSAGIISEIAVSKKLKIDMGIAYAQQNLNPNSNGGMLNARTSDASQNYSGQQFREQAIAGNQFFAGNLISATEELRFGQLEIPINLKYKLLERNKADIYFVSGISNMFYLNQERISTLNFANLSAAGNIGNGIQSFSQRSVPDASSSDVNIGQLVNVAVGFEQNLSNGTFLYIEPFYKMSVGNQTFAEQQFSIGGINLRMNFQFKK